VSGHSKAVLWIGVILITLNLFFGGGWSQIWKTLTTGSSGGGVGLIPLPIPGLPLLPIAKTSPTPATAKAGTVLA
jgi:hypothetical protein